MGMPRVLKDKMLFNEGLAYLGECKSITLPVLTRKMEEWKVGGGVLKMDMGQEAMSMTHTYGGPMREILRQYGVTTVDGTYLRFAGNYQQEDTASIDTIEVIVRGRHSEIDMGDAEDGEAGEFKVSTEVAYYKLVWNGRTELEIDPLNMIFVVDGVDLMAERRAAIGLF
ncbi:phage major tail tube protein [uncultured Novosphingobium sp.]|uniref:phage major tail tube protein n=1 Tax=uncultured Novosphingobium sp. TaxID=292277 RepID=UPI002595A6D9|nr:phage major tail tube protein [uncultured Novosphingobium sp.]